MLTTFKSIAVGQAFTCNGTPYVKKSSRTAWAGVGHPVYDHEVKRWFYFGGKEQVRV